MQPVFRLAGHCISSDRASVLRLSRLFSCSASRYIRLDSGLCPVHTAGRSRSEWTNDFSLDVDACQGQDIAVPCTRSERGKASWDVVGDFMHHAEGISHCGTLETDRRIHTFLSPSRLLLNTHTSLQRLTGNVTLVRPFSSVSMTPSTKRLPKSRKEEIEEVLEDSREVIQEFASVLGCGRETVEDMVRGDTRLVTQFPKDGVVAKMRLLLDHGFGPGEITSRHQVFTRSYSRIQSRLMTMESVKHYRHRLATLLLTDTRFQSRMADHRKEVTVMGDHPSQTSFVAELLECSEEEVMSLVHQGHFDFLLTLPPSRLKEIVSILRSFAVSVAEMREKCLMLKCLPEVARQRLQRVRDAGVFEPQVVSYILTNSETHFENSFATWVRNAEAISGYTDERDLLMRRLQCSEDDVENMMVRTPAVAGMTSFKLKRCLDTLQQEIGLSNETIVRYSELLFYSPRRHLSRWALLKPFDLSEAALVRQLLLPERKYVAKYGYGSDLL